MRPVTTLELLATPAGVSAVRRSPRDYGPDVQLCASELVTNVVQHLGEDVPVTVRVSRDDGGRTRLEVTDPDPRVLPVLRAAVGADAESGQARVLGGRDRRRHRVGDDTGAHGRLGGGGGPARDPAAR
ncbi:ATP-binding protein [Streptomyces sp. NPDC000931]|uniref:ATP-binding protein n=1 Tax=Streptomyces sp. NPDC000931 TaxID=3154372 RepID=UPI00332D8F58